MTEEQRSAIGAAIAECEERAKNATEAMLTLKQEARVLRQRAYALRSLLAGQSGVVPQGTGGG